MIRMGLPVVVAFVLMAVGVVGSAEAQEASLFQGSGSFVAGGTTIDTNDDGTTADLVILEGSSSLLGPITNQAVVEWTFDDEPTIACPLGTVLEGTLAPAGSAVVTRHAASGDLLFGTFTSGTNCISATGLASISAAGNFTGGTGLFADATGIFTLTATLTTLVPRPFLQEDERGVRRHRSHRHRPSAPAFGSVVVTVDGMITLK